MWSDSPVQSSEVSLVLKFRISGQGKTLFGDGIGLWIVGGNGYVAGQFHGITETFHGVGIVLDTFRNSENALVHKDVSIYVNDGTKHLDQLLHEERVGCDANIRYHEKRADFSVKNSSRVRVVVKPSSIIVHVDERSTGEWADCGTVVDLPFHADWLNTAFIGLTGTTGALADNHDVLSLKAYNNPIEHGDESRAEQEGSKMDQLLHHLEHQFVAIQDSLQNSLKKLEKQENLAVDRIAALEGVIGAKINESLEQRVAALEALNLQQVAEQEQRARQRISGMEAKWGSDAEKILGQRMERLEATLTNQVESSIEGRLQALEQRVERNIEQRLKRLEVGLRKQLTDGMATTVGAWHIPFGVIVAGIGAGLFFVLIKFGRIVSMLSSRSGRAV